MKLVIELETVEGLKNCEIELSDDVYEEIRQAAKRFHKSEEEIVETLMKIELSSVLSDEK